MQHVRYEVEGWGVGELWLRGDTLLQHEAPSRELVFREHKGHALAGRFRDWFAGAGDDFADVELDLDWATPFQRSLAEELRRIPRGEVVTYGELAALAGKPGAARAAGSFCAQNRFFLVVPCHRVVGASGIGGYGSLGLGYKRRLLELEGVSL